MQNKMNQFIEIRKRTLLSFCLVCAILTLLMWIALIQVPSQGYAYLGADINQTLNTTVNITNAQPEVKEVRLDDPIDLEAYGNKTVYCNATVFDWDNDSVTVNASIFIEGLADPTSGTDNNYHYQNVSCTRTTPQDREMNYACSVQMAYYAFNSSNWICNVSVEDDEGAYSTNTSDYSTVNTLIALYVPGVLNFGELAVNDVSTDKLANITNAGNINASISVEGWGATKGDGLAMNCTYGSIDVEYERYNHTTTGLDWETELTPLTNESKLIQNFLIHQRFDDTSTDDSTNTTYWQLKIPPGAGGICNGKILFTAGSS